MNLDLTYQSNYNGWSVDPDQEGLTEELADKIADTLPMITWEECDKDGYYGGDKFPPRIVDKIEDAVRAIVPECTGITIEFDDISS